MSARPRTTPGNLLNKVPEVTLYFWIIKILCTTVGESLADYINTSLGLGLGGTAAVFSVLLAVALGVQFRARQYVPAVYWIVVVLVSVTGTLYTDILTDQMGIPLSLSSAVFTLLLIAVFGIWYARERTLSIHSINSVPRESFYWLTVLVTFALGTATGDWILELTGWTPGQSVLLPITLIAVIALGWRLGANAVLAFWLAYILTRPMGANLGDYLGRSPAEGGLGVGLFATSLIFLVAISAIVFYLTRTRVDVVQPGQETGPRPTTVGRERLVLAGWVVAAAVASVVVGVAASNNTGGAALAEAPAPVAALAPGQKAQALTPADLGSITAISKDTLSLVQGGQQKKAAARATDLETAWDDAAASLQAKNPDRWQNLDGQVDAVLKSVRANKPDQAAETTALTTLLNSLAG
jgi:uncharacterized membrane-anchored protein